LTAFASEILTIRLSEIKKINSRPTQIPAEIGNADDLKLQIDGLNGNLTGSLSNNGKLKKKSFDEQRIRVIEKLNAPGMIRTCDPLIRSPIDLASLVPTRLVSWEKSFYRTAITYSNRLVASRN